MAVKIATDTAYDWFSAMWETTGQRGQAWSYVVQCATGEGMTVQAAKRLANKCHRMSYGGK